MITHPIPAEVNTVDSPTHGLSIPPFLSEFGPVLSFSRRQCPWTPLRFHFQRHQLSIMDQVWPIQQQTLISSSAVFHSSPNGSLHFCADPLAIPTPVAISTAISAKFLKQQQAPTHEAFSIASRIIFTASTTTMQPFQPVNHGFHATMPSDCQHPACSPADDIRFQETLHPDDAI